MKPGLWRGRDLLSMLDLSAEEIVMVLDYAARLKEMQRRREPHPWLAGKTLAMIFHKPSTRTRISFEVAMNQLGGHSLFLGPGELQVGRWKEMADMARVLSRYVEGIAVRTFGQEIAEELARHATVPVINGLTDKEHPCQILADLLTIREQKGRLEGLRAAYVGDGNNVAHSLMLACPRVGMDLVVATPPAYRPEPDVVAAAREMAARSGTRLELVEDPVAAVSEADVVFTDVWASIGKEAEAAERERVFRPYQVNADLVRHARPDFMFLHCLPARRGEEVTEEVIDGPASFVWDAAENRLHVQKALLTLTMGE